MAIVGAAGAMPPDTADYICRLEHRSTTAGSLGRLPRPLRDYVRTRLGEIADRGGRFNPTDVGGGPFLRFIRGGEIGHDYYLWYEHGGITYWKQAVLIDRGGRVIGQTAVAGNGGLCAATDMLVAKAPN